MTLVEFLLARVAEDEATARAAVRGTPVGEGSGWYWSNAGDGVFLDETDVCVVCGPWRRPMYPAVGHHIARWDPDRVLAECDSKRLLAERHLPQQGDGDVTRCGECAGVTDEPDPTPWPCPTLRLLALPYADHPDYTAEWRL